jgi:hypothetical protein
MMDWLLGKNFESKYESSGKNESSVWMAPILAFNSLYLVTGLGR